LTPDSCPLTPVPEDVALFLHTSGTTSRPKGVPLTHGNLMASIANIAATYQLTPRDRSLIVMPLFHVHGLIGATLSTLHTGGAVVVPAKFSAGAFWQMAARYAVTWYSAVPTIHQILLSRADQDNAPRRGLRFIRSCSSALAPAVFHLLEERFGAPVLEAYGMTEAAHQMASNPLPPGPRKPGFVGKGTGVDIAILDDQGQVLPAGKQGEVSIRGNNVMHGYLNNSEANASSFSNGYFRTGDQGVLDENGYLMLTGRLKELINRGGEKIAPREIDEVLLAHPGVQQAVAFAVPHPSLGEDIAAAVVLKDGAPGCEAAFREFALDRLPMFKVPSRIILVNDVPKGWTGKIQRVGLAERLAAALAVPYEGPASDTERLVATTICEVLNCEKVGRNDNFFSLGGDSLRATQVLTRLGQSLGFQIPVPTVFRCPTPALLANKLDLMREPEIDALAAELEKLPPEERARVLNDL